MYPHMGPKLPGVGASQGIGSTQARGDEAADSEWGGQVFISSYKWSVGRVSCGAHLA